MNDLPHPGSTLREVLPGSPDDLDVPAVALESYVDRASAACRGMAKLDSGTWIGAAAEAFRSSVAKVFDELEQASFAFEEAALAVRTYAAVFRDAQADVVRALALIDEADRESKRWSATNSQALIQNFTAPYTGTLAPLAPDDPGESIRRQGCTLVTEARDRVTAAACHATDRLQTAAKHAPRNHGLWSGVAHVVSEVGAGAFESTKGVAEFAFKLTPGYELIDPEGYVENAEGVFRGLVYGAAHPVDFAKAVLDWDTWADSPGRAIGHLLPAIALVVASAGAGATVPAAEAGAAAEGAGALREATDLMTAASDLTAEQLTDRTPGELRNLAHEKGFEPHGQPDAEGNYRKFRDPATKTPRLRIDQGHTDPVTDLPYDDPRAAVPHAHGYDPDGKPITDPTSGNKHFPLR
jgi:uncharacterized protein YukE